MERLLTVDEVLLEDVRPRPTDDNGCVADALLSPPFIHLGVSTFEILLFVVIDDVIDDDADELVDSDFCSKNES